MVLTVLVVMLLLFQPVSIAGGLFDSLEGLDIDEQLSRLTDMISAIDLGDEDETDDLEEDDFCKFTCPNGAEPVPRKTHRPSFDGCGAFGVKISSDLLPEMTTCCNHHDLCYDTCAADRDRCDDEFKNCLDTLCDRKKTRFTPSEHEACKNGATLMYLGTTALGCTPYLTAQKAACTCAAGTTSSPRREDSTKDSKKKAKQRNDKKNNPTLKSKENYRNENKNKTPIKEKTAGVRKDRKKEEL